MRLASPFPARAAAVLVFSYLIQTPLPSLADAPAQDLAAGFVKPPDAAKPRVWWHWIDGNVTDEGITLDLEWLKGIGIGGVQNFDAALSNPNRPTAKTVDRRVAYLTPEWQERFRHAVDLAETLDLEFTIASSPGWSESGGPWVKPNQAMKKLVWSETHLRGGDGNVVKLTEPPRTTGPFQNVPLTAVPFAAGEGGPAYYRDVAVLAYPSEGAEAADSVAQPFVSSSSGPLDAHLLVDGDLTHAVQLPFGDGPTAWVELRYAKPRKIRSITAAVARPNSIAPSDTASGGQIWLESSNDGRTYHKVVDIPRSGTLEQTIAFAPVYARFFRIVFARPAPLDPGPLADFLPQGPAPTAHLIYELQLRSAARVNRFEDKAGWSNRAIEEADDTPLVEKTAALAREKVLNLTDQLRPDGTLAWTAPRGNWVVLRFGYSLTGRTNHPATKEGTGLEVDKLNRSHVRDYFNSYLDVYDKTLGADRMSQHVLKYMLTDSYEAGIANWTDDLVEQFKQRRGYDPLPWLLVLAGRVVEDSRQSDAFLWDFRQTLGDLIADAHYSELSSLLHAHGMGRYGESHEAGRAFQGDGMQVKKSADVPMGAMWSSTLGQPRETFDADIRESASVAHIYGQNLVAAESLTAFGETFAFTPEKLKPYADRELAMGLNRFVIHTSVHQPDSRPGPGVTLGPFGQWFTRHETWSSMAQPWITYLARSSFLLQQGKFAADVLYLYGEGNNITNLFGARAPDLPVGYSYDYINADALIHMISGQGGRLSTATGMSYSALVLDPSTDRMSLAALRKISELAQQGVPIVGAKPRGSPSEADDPDEFRTLANALWGSTGHVSAVADLPQILRFNGIEPDCLLNAGQPVTTRFVHRHTPEADIYFISSASPDAVDLQASLRISGRQPEFWHADSGKIEPAPFQVVGGRTVVPLSMEPNGAIFVVFRRATSEFRRLVPSPRSERVQAIVGPWDLFFPPNLGAPEQTRMTALTSWAESPVSGIKYFSGTATYRTRFKVLRRDLQQHERLLLDLGDVKDVAQVLLNGRDAGIVWKRPFRIDVKELLRAGDNLLEVKVANVWPNRLIGDHQPGMQRIAYSTFDPYRSDSPLLPAGLLGPVTLTGQTQPH